MNSKQWYFCCTWVLAMSSVGALNIPDEDWNKVATDILNAALRQSPNTNIAKNVILFLGDGMGISTVTTARIYKGQKDGNPGEETVLSFEKFPYVALSKTYNVDHQVPDSAGTATAYLCGVKANYGTVGVTHKVKRKTCDLQENQKVTSILKWSAQTGKSTGIVTTARLTHASPSAAYAHTSERYWESDKDLDPAHSGLCKDIAAQLIDEHAYIQVLMGGGRRNFWPSNSVDLEYSNLNGTRIDQRNLIQEWENTQQLKQSRYASFWNKDSFDAVNPANVDYILGLFEPSHMEYELDRVKKSPPTEPSLAEMTEKAIQVLSKEDKGYFLFVEGGRIDHAHHDALPKKALEDTVAFDEAIAQAVKMTSSEDTLIIVTADHSHVFTQGGYPARGRPILGFVGPESEAIEKTTDGFPTMILGYANGPRSGRFNLTGEDTEAEDFVLPALAEMEYETHGGEDVGIFASGPWAHLFHGVHEQNYIAHVMGYASCVGDHIAKGEHCTNKGTSAASRVTSGVLFMYIIFLLGYVKGIY